MRLALVLVAGCADFAAIAHHNAPGNVVLDHPIAHEDGNPVTFERPTDPGRTTIAFAVAPYLVAGIGRRSSPHGSGETGVEFRFERSDRELVARDNWGISIGMGITQWAIDSNMYGAGPFFAEAGYRWFPTQMYPLDVSAGPVYYVDGGTPGVQLTVRSLLLLVRTRYVVNSGIELFVGGELPLPCFLGWSK